MTKILKSLCLTVMLMLACCSVSFAAQATLPDSEIAIGGLTVGMSPGNVQDIYGAPDQINSKNGQLFYSYGGTVNILFKKNYDNNNPDVEINQIKVTANNGFTTPSGLHVGMTYSEMVNLYGKHPAMAGPPHGNEIGYIYYSSKGNVLSIQTVNKKITGIVVRVN